MPGTSTGTTPGAGRRAHHDPQTGRRAALPRRSALGGTWRLLLVLAGFLAVTAGLARYAASVAAPGPDGLLAAVAALRVDQVVELAVLAGGTVAAAWVALSASVALAYVLADRAGHRWRTGAILLERVAPAAVRRLARSAVGVGVGTGLVLAPTAAFAADGATGHDAGDPVSSVAVESPAGVPVDLGWQATTPIVHDADDTGGDTTTGSDTITDIPAVDDGTSDDGTSDDRTSDDRTSDDRTSDDRTSDDRTSDDAADAVPAAPRARTPTAAAPVVRNLRPAHDDGGATYVVLRGDTLWDLAARSLDGAPTDAEVLREVTRWHSVNRDVVGADPDVILPGQVLQVPD